MFDQVFDNFRKATETTVQMQQEMFKKWTALWPGLPASSPGWGEQVKQFQKKWAEFVNDLVKRKRGTIETQFKVGLENLEKAFRLGEAKSPEELRAQVLELWQKSFDCLRQTYEAQLTDFQAALTKWIELLPPEGHRPRPFLGGMALRPYNRKWRANEEVCP